MPVLLCPAQNSHGLYWDLTRSLELISQRFIFYGDHVHFRHHSATTAAKCSGMIPRETRGWVLRTELIKTRVFRDVTPCRLLNGS
jgi:hypothetical protein